MFILKRENVEIVNVKLAAQERKIPILKYNGQTFRLINVFPTEKAEEALNFWRDLADNQHKFCILLEETERYSIWGKVKIKAKLPEKSNQIQVSPLIQAFFLLLQTIHLEIEDLFGTRQAARFIEDICKVGRENNVPEMNVPSRVEHLLRVDPLEETNLPDWQEDHLVLTFQALHRLGKQYFGNVHFAEGIEEVIKDLPNQDQKLFLAWLNYKSLNKLWH